GAGLDQQALHVRRLPRLQAARRADCRADHPRTGAAERLSLATMEMAEDNFSRRACAWPRRPREAGPVRMISPAEVPTWILFEDERLLVVNKPGDVVCHPSKAGPWSSLVGALREYTGLPA